MNRWRATGDSVYAAALATGDAAAAQHAVDAWESEHPQPRASVADVADHIDHIRDIAGIDHIGIGSDFDGITSVPIGLQDVSTFPVLFAELLRRGYSDQDVRQIAGLNVLRAMREMEDVAAAMQAEMGPVLN